MEPLSSTPGDRLPTFLPDGEPGQIPSPEEAAQLPTAPPRLHSVLTIAQEDLVANELAEMLDAYDETMAKRQKRERLIEECYNLVPQKDWQGDYPDASELIAETLMADVDQAQARLSSLLLSVKPLVRVEGVESVFPPEDSQEIAEKIQDFLDRYLRYVIKAHRIIPQALYPTTKFGTGILDIRWVGGPDDGKVEWTLIQNSDAVVWPSWETDWQKLEWAGHKMPLTVSQLRRLCNDLGVPKAIYDKIERESGTAGEKSKQGVDTFASLMDDGVDPGPLTSVKEYGVLDVYRLSGSVLLPTEKTERKIEVLFERGSKTIIASEVNDQVSGNHSTFPMRYKISGMTAWGKGVGDECLNAQASDTMFNNLESDVIASSCFPIFLVKPTSIADAIWDRPGPGQRIPTDDPTGDFRKEQLADSTPLQMLSFARAANDQRKTRATGMSSVLQGQGDTNLKSGGGTGSTMALISEGNKKFEAVDRNIREDLSAACLHTLELCWQYSNGTVFAKFMAAEDAEFLVAALTNIPHDRPLAESLRITIDAPSPSNNDEMRKQENLVVYKMLVEHAGVMIQTFAMQVLTATNPAAMIPYMLSWEEVIATMSQTLLDSHQIPGVKESVPHLKDFIQPTPQDAQINMLMQQLAQTQQQLQSVLQMAASAPPVGRADEERGRSESSPPNGGAPS